MNTTQTITFAGKTAEEWRAEAANCYARREESFERCDTDGFLSQWAEQQMAAHYHRCAEIAEDGGYIQFTAPIDLTTGEIIKGRWISGKGDYGRTWSAWAPADSSRRLIYPSEAKTKAVQDRNDAKRGIKQVRVKAPALLSHRSTDIYPDVNADWIILDYAAQAEFEQHEPRPTWAQPIVGDWQHGRRTVSA